MSRASASLDICQINETQSNDNHSQDTGLSHLSDLSNIKTDALVEERRDLIDQSGDYCEGDSLLTYPHYILLFKRKLVTCPIRNYKTCFTLSESFVLNTK